MAIQVRSKSCYESQMPIGGGGVVLGKFLSRIMQQEVSLLFAGNGRHGYFVLTCVVGPEYGRMYGQAAATRSLTPRRC